MNKNILKKNLPSFCTSNFDVLKIIMLFSKFNNLPILIESTSNQVNQNGGYTGLTPSKFAKKVYSLSSSLKLNKKKILLGGDHLGPLPWKNLSKKKALANAKILVKNCLKAKYKKIHIDTAIICKDEKKITRADIISRCKLILNNIKDKELKNTFLVVGTEVPFAGGGQNSKIVPTKISSIKEEYDQYKILFDNRKLIKNKKFSMVIEPGIEFFHNKVKRTNLKDFKKKLNFSKKNKFSYEAHSSDYQKEKDLRKLVKNNFQFLKVGPELTYFFSKSIFAMENIEKKLFKRVSNLKYKFDKVMKNNKKYWKLYYRGKPAKIEYLKFNSYLDRIRYYWNFSEINKSKLILESNINKIENNIFLRVFKLNKKQILIKKKLNLKNFDMIVYIFLSKTLEKYYRACGFKTKN
ncbi:MAG: class II D-tagatose-bisphosphate aldolase non-catalytic subunit [Pelagibacteraceae bacterium]